MTYKRKIPRLPEEFGRHMMDVAVEQLKLMGVVLVSKTDLDELVSCYDSALRTRENLEGLPEGTIPNRFAWLASTSQDNNSDKGNKDG